jgi:hypothetical protein
MNLYSRRFSNIAGFEWSYVITLHRDDRGVRLIKMALVPHTGGEADEWESPDIGPDLLEVEEAWYWLLGRWFEESGRELTPAAKSHILLKLREYDIQLAEACANTDIGAQ